MKIRGWSIEGYGVFHDYEVRDLGDGLTVFLGPNEAGKSTLLSFLRGVLFGFPDARSKDPLYPPFRGGRHLGRIFLTNGTGEYVVERQAGARRVPQVTLPGGGAGGEADLQRLLGGADSKLFRSVFAFGLTELQEFGTLNDEGISDQIFSAGIAGAGRSARDAIRELDARTAELLKHGKGNARINNLERELTEVDTAIAAAQNQAGRYSELLESELTHEDSVASLGEQIRELEQEARRLDSLVGLWPVYSELESSREQLVEIRSEAQLEAVASEAEALRQAIDLYRDRVAQIPGAEEGLRSTQTELDELLRELGENWNEERLSEFDTSIPAREVVRGWGNRLDKADSDLEAAQRVLAGAERDETTAKTALERVQARLPEREPMSSDAVQESQAVIARLRANLFELRTHEATGATQPRGRELIPAWSIRALLAVVIGLAATVGLNAASAGSNVVRAALGVTLVATFAIGTHDYLKSRRRPEKSLTESPGDGATRPIDLSRQIEEDAMLLDLPSLPSLVEVEERWNSLERERQDRQRWDEIQLDLNETKGDLDGAVGVREAADLGVDQTRTAHGQEQKAWSEWKEAQDLPGALGAEGVIDFFDTIRNGRALLRKKSGAEGQIVNLKGEVEGWEKRAKGALESAGRTTGSSGEGLIAEVIELDGDCKRRAGLAETIEGRSRTIDESLGQGEAADALRSALATGDLDGWKQRQAEIEQELVDLKPGRDAAVRQHQIAKSAREALEESADLPELETRRESLREDLATATREWRVATIAKALIEETLAEFERTRQPQVLANAQKSFEAVTNGRYARLAQDLANDELAIFDARGGRKTPPELSRGTAEQLYLCIRLGLAAEFAARSGDLPLVMDDVLVNFDPVRAKATAHLIAEFSRDHQVLLFTCHPTTRDLLQAASDGEVRVLEMARED